MTQEPVQLPEALDGAEAELAACVAERRRPRVPPPPPQAATPMTAAIVVKIFSNLFMRAR